MSIYRNKFKEFAIDFRELVESATNFTPYYVHYGSNKFDKNSFINVRNIDYTKIGYYPEGHRTKPEFGTGLWASPIHSRANWRNLCIGYDLSGLKAIKDKKYFVFKLAKDANVVRIKSMKDFDNFSYFKIDNKECSILFEEAIADGIDAIELCLESKEWDELEDALFGWDCSSILIMNPNIVKVSKRKLKEGHFLGFPILLDCEV